MRGSEMTSPVANIGTFTVIVNLLLLLSLKLIQG